MCILNKWKVKFSKISIFSQGFNNTSLNFLATLINLIKIQTKFASNNIFSSHSLYNSDRYSILRLLVSFIDPSKYQAAHSAVHWPNGSCNLWPVWKSTWNNSCFDQISGKVSLNLRCHDQFILWKIHSSSTYLRI